MVGRVYPTPKPPPQSIGEGALSTLSGDLGLEFCHRGTEKSKGEYQIINRVFNYPALVEY